jgi:hypothetical protein
MSVYFAQHLLNTKTGCNCLIVTKLGLWHLSVLHLAQGSFLPNNQTLQNGFLIYVYVIVWCCQQLDVILVNTRNQPIRS